MGWSLLLGVWDGFAPQGRELCVALPSAASMFFAALLCVLLVHRLAAVIPGKKAIAEAAESVRPKWWQAECTKDSSSSGGSSYYSV